MWTAPRYILLGSCIALSFTLHHTNDQFFSDAVKLSEKQLLEAAVMPVVRNNGKGPGDEHFSADTFLHQYNPLFGRNGLSGHLQAYELAQRVENSMDEAADLGCTAFNFYGQPVCVDLPYPGEFRMETADERKVAGSYGLWNSGEWAVVLKQMDHYWDRMRLNDWGKFRFTELLAEKHFKDPNARTFFSWFFLQKAGFDLKLGFQGDQLLFLYACEQMVYGVNFLTYDGKRYFIYGDFGRARSYRQLASFRDGNKSGKAVDLTIRERVNLPYQAVEKGISFTHNGTDYQFRIPVNSNLIAYYGDMPWHDFESRLLAPMDPMTLYALEMELLPFIKHMDERESVDFLLRFVQTAFDYQVDQRQFGYEKNCFAEETLFYEGSDCDDRVVLFIQLVRNLLGKEAIALDYPGHISAAVALDGDRTDGHYFRFRDQWFIMSDPTFIGAEAGMVMPEFKGMRPQVIAAGFD